MTPRNVLALWLTQSRETMKNRIIIAAVCLFAAPAFAETPATSSASLFKQGQAAEKAGDPVAAQDFYQKSLKANPNNADARYSLGQVKIHAPEIAAKGREAKFGAVIIPVFQLDSATLQEALDALGLAIGTQTKDEITPNFVIQDPKQKFADSKITLDLKAMPAKAVMKYLTDQTGAKVRYDEHAVVVTAK